MSVQNTEAEERFKEELTEAFEEYGTMDDDDDFEERNETAELDEAVDHLQQEVKNMTTTV